jgi:hypothetical protein
MMTHNRVEERGLSGAVWPNKTNDFFFPDLEGYVIIRHDATEVLRNVLKSQMRCHKCLAFLSEIMGT